MLQATEIADLILKGFRRHFALFQKITALAQQSFAQRNWLELQRISSERISYYDLRVNETLTLLQQKLTGTELNECLWQQVKQQYQQYLLFHPQAELAETFYNSVFCRLYERKYFHNQNIFVESTLSKQRLPAPVASVYESYFPAQYGLKQSIRAIVASFQLQAPFVDLERDIRLLVRTFIGQSSHGHFPVHLVRFDILKSLFFRNKAAYIVGRVVTPDGQQPFIIPLLHDDERGIYMDTLITDPQQMTIIFGFLQLT